MTGLAVVLGVVAAPLPANPWSVAPDGKSCVQLEQPLRDELASWTEDVENTMPEEGIWGRTNPDKPRQLVLLFSSREVCKQMVAAIARTGPVKRMTAAEVKREVERQLKTDRTLSALFVKLGAKQQKALLTATTALFAGSAHRIRASKRLDAAEKAGRATTARDSCLDQVRLALWSHLFEIVFGEAYLRPTED